MKISDLKGNYTVTSSKYVTIPEMDTPPPEKDIPVPSGNPLKDKIGDISNLAPALKPSDFLKGSGELIKGAYDTGKKIVKSVATAPFTIATGLGETTGLSRPGSTYSPEGTYAGDVKKDIESGTDPALAALKAGSEAALDVATVGEGFNLAKGYAAKKVASAAANKSIGETSKITEMISPKPTTKEAKLAQTQGRFVEGKSPTLFKSGTADTIAPSAKTQSAAQTIKDNIPRAARMSPTELYKSVDKKITDTATKLRPQMEATPIQPQTIERINTDWESLKKSQIAEAPATEEANVAKRQAKFEALLKKSGNGNHADLWDTRINYDNSIPDGVKKANSLSSESLQLQKEEWLDNRRILNEAIDSNARPEFKVMSDLYEAKNGLLSQTKLDKGQVSKINQFLKDNPKTAKILGGVTIYEVAKNLGISLP